MDKRWLGRTNIQVGRLGLGCVTFGRELDEMSGRLMSAALDLGMTLFDTAEAYGGGQARQYRRNTLGVDDVREASSEMHSSEKIVGRWSPAVTDLALSCKPRLRQTSHSSMFKMLLMPA